MDAPEAFKERLNNTVKRIRNTDKSSFELYAEFQFNNADCCPLLDDDGLCSLQNRAVSLPKRLLLLGVALRNLSEVKCTAPEIKKWLQKYALFAQGDSACNVLDSIKVDRFLFLSQNIFVVCKLKDEYHWVETLQWSVGAALSVKDGIMDCTFEISQYQTRKQALHNALGDIEFSFENIMVAAVLNLEFPNLSNAEELWKSYVNLCNLYSFYRFAAVTGCGSPPSKDELIHILVMASRALLHNRTRQARLRDDFFNNNS